MQIPKYFAPDALQLISDEDTQIEGEAVERLGGLAAGAHAYGERLDYRDDWPSLFIGAWSWSHFPLLGNVKLWRALFVRFEWSSDAKEVLACN